MCLPFPGRGPCLWRGASQAGPTWGAGLGAWVGISTPGSCFLSLSHWGARLSSPGPLCCYPAASQTWLALTTEDSLASTQAWATACPSGSLSLSAQGPPGLGSRSGQSGLSPVPKPDGQSAYRITASPGPIPPPPMVGPGSCLGWRSPLVGPSTGLPCSGKGSGGQDTKHVLAADSLGWPCLPHPQISVSP